MIILRTMQVALKISFDSILLTRLVLRKHLSSSCLPQERCLADQQGRCRDTQPELYVETAGDAMPSSRDLSWRQTCLCGG